MQRVCLVGLGKGFSHQASSPSEAARSDWEPLSMAGAAGASQGSRVQNLNRHIA